MDSYVKFAKIYDELINEDIDYEKMAFFIKNQVRKFTSYLDLGAGTGNLSCLLGPSFKESYLVDLSPDMLTLASEKFESLEIPYQSFAIPMTEIKFSKTFSLITSSMDSINYILEEDEVIRLFHRVYEHLDDEGVFIFDLNSTYKIRTILGNNDYIYNSEDLVYTWQNTLEDDVVEMDLNFFLGKGSLYERFEEIHLERAYEKETIASWLNEAGFELSSINPGYAEGLILENTERWVFIARKR